MGHFGGCGREPSLVDRCFDFFFRRGDILLGSVFCLIVLFRKEVLFSLLFGWSLRGIDLQDQQRQVNWKGVGGV